MLDEFSNRQLVKMLEDKRVIFPLTDFYMNVTGFVGRNPRGESYYKCCGNGFFGYCDTTQDTIIIAEGVLHVIPAQLKGFDNVLGFESEFVFSEKNLKAIRLLGKRVIFFAESDRLGIKVAIRTVSKLRSNGIKAVVYRTDKARDLYEFIIKGYSLEEVLSSVSF